jgi:hypothetical protein
MIKKKKKVPVESGIQVFEYRLMAESVETGIGFGCSEIEGLFKGKMAQARFEAFKEHLHNELMNAICDRFYFPERLD